MTKVLNLDEVETKLEKAIKFGGKEYVMSPLSVGDYVAQLKELQAIDQEKDPAQVFEKMIASVVRAFPTMKEAQARKMTLSQLEALTRFIRGEVDAETETGKK